MDPLSSSNNDEATINNISLNWNVDFSNQRINGSATLTTNVIKSTDKIVLDIQGLSIDSVKVSGEEAPFDVQLAGILGEKLIIQIEKLSPGDQIDILVQYTTGTNCRALQFLESAQTALKKEPFLYSQCQSINARSIVPCMDTPSVKQTYDAQVTVPEELICLMSAVAVGEPRQLVGLKKYSFKQSIRIPSYLLAIVVGLLEKRELSDRCAVWAEPPVIEAALYEFYETEKMLSVAESLAGKYVWGRYDLVILPPSFPFGGMENPCLTFVTPTLLAGDRSLANVVGHEISHSWTGNLVTNANWEHFWLNEGFTTYLERKLVGRLEGEEERQFEAQCGWEDHLLDAVTEQYDEQHPFTKLIPDLRGKDPDDAFSSIPYEKGSALLMYIEQQIGDTPAFEEFLRKYTQKFAQKSIVTSDWKAFLYESFPTKKDVLDRIDWDNWFHGTGMPKNKPNFDSRRMARVKKMAEEWANTKDDNLDRIALYDYHALSTRQKIKLLDCLRKSSKPLSHRLLEKLDEVNKFSKSGNCEILFTWIRIGLKAYWPKIVPAALEFVTRYGRLKYVRPIYKELFLWTETDGRAIETFSKNAPFMHPITASVVNKLILK